MRGAPDKVTPGLLPLGIIPADAGSTPSYKRGGVEYRIIPADAGSTPLSTPSKIQRTDHPRGCGEHTFLFSDSSMQEGSSPRMRGAHRGQRHQVDHVRIIPADAGSTDSQGNFVGLAKDHPRGCGEHRRSVRGRRRGGGSSPRMRGALFLAASSRARNGIIPADAGSTCWCPSATIPDEDHPRGCGEHGDGLTVQLPDWGSSPRMRGARISAVSFHTVHRIIPADAGSTWR